MRWFIRLAVAVALIVLAMVIVAFASPALTKHARTITLKETPEAIFAVLADVQKMPEWNRELSTVEMLPPTDGKETTRQTFKTGMKMTIVTTESLSPTHLVRAMRADNSGTPFIGTWTYEITPVEAGSKVTLIEVAEIKNPMFRLMVRLFGPTKYMDEHLVDLARRLDDNARPE